MTPRNSLDTLERRGAFVAGPSSTLTVPGVVVSQIVGALSSMARVTRVEVNEGSDFDAGLHRVPFLAAAHDWGRLLNIESRQAPANPRLRARAFAEWLDEDVAVAVAFIWPGLDTSWVRPYFDAARRVGARTVAILASVPRATSANLATVAGALTMADHIVVGDEATRAGLARQRGSLESRIAVNPALYLRGREPGQGNQQITAFLPRDDEQSLAVLLSAFDAIPEAWAPNYRLHVVMRFDEAPVEELVAASHHSEFISITSDTIRRDDLRALCAGSSAIIIADPTVDSRAFAVAVECGVATVVLTSGDVPLVGSGYVGGLIADQTLPVSVHVALHHALRLAGLNFPPPRAWDDLVQSILEEAHTTEVSVDDLAAVSGPG